MSRKIWIKKAKGEGLKANGKKKNDDRKDWRGEDHLHF